jgi:hypothetical protein
MNSLDRLAPYLRREVHVVVNAGRVNLMTVGVLHQADPGEYFVHGRPVGTLAHFLAADVASVAAQDLPTADGGVVVVIELRIPPA